MAIDIYLKIEKDFGIDAQEVREVLEDIVFLANGNLKDFYNKVELARTDWRDVLLQAEYSYPENIRVRDFNKSFFELGLLSKNS